MCDSFTALSSVTKDGSSYLAKSADCEVNEAHYLVNVPSQKHPRGKFLRTTHLTIPQVEQTYEVVLSKSFWTWGCEMGINQHGLAMGNEAVHSNKSAAETKDGLYGMDLMRLGLERARNCREAIKIMGALLVEYGQGGNCELSGNSHFDCSFLMLDNEEAWVLEAAGRDWCAKQVQDYASISNILSIGTDWELSSITEKGFNWAANMGRPETDDDKRAGKRQACTYRAMADAAGKIDLNTMFAALRQHAVGFDPASKQHEPSICMHVGPGEDISWAANSAMVAQLHPLGPLTWLTGTAGTCLSIFKPVYMHCQLPEIGPSPTEIYDPETLWWQHETLHRLAMRDFANIQPEIRAEFDELEAEFQKDAIGLLPYTTYQRKDFMDFCFNKAWDATEKWIDDLSSRKLAYPNEQMAQTWEKFNRQAAMTHLV